MGDCLSRREAAALLGFASEFKVRQLERAGRLRPLRGPMGSAWYPREQVVALRVAVAGRPAAATSDAGAAKPVGGRISDAALISYLRGMVRTDEADFPRIPTVVDLVADTGIAIGRAEKLYRFWLAQDQHPAAAAARASRGETRASLVAVASRKPAHASADQGTAMATAIAAESARRSPPEGASTERRGRARVERDHLIRELRHPDPSVRAAAFDRLKPGRSSG